MKILYLHGLDGELSPEKAACLAPFGEVIAPNLDYRADSNIFSTLEKQCKDGGINVIMGSSMGGFAGYYLSWLLQTPALLFNPALPYRSVKQQVLRISSTRQKQLQIVLGNQDDTIKAQDNLLFLKDAISPEIKVDIHLINQLGHRIPINVFKAEVDFFFNAYKLTSLAGEV